jgi:hypothetical protein
MVAYPDLISWHTGLADLYLAPADADKRAEYEQEAVRQDKIVQENTAAWERSKGKDHLVRDRAVIADRLAHQARHKALIAGAPSDPGAYVMHSLAAAQIKAVHGKTSIDEAVAREVKRLVAHSNQDVVKTATRHPNHGIMLSRDAA